MPLTYQRETKIKTQKVIYRLHYRKGDFYDSITNSSLMHRAKTTSSHIILFRPLASD